MFVQDSPVERNAMSDYKLAEVDSRKALEAFIQFPDRLYKDCPHYVPALHSDQRRSLTAVSTLKYCRRKLWTVLEGRRVVGRICGMINPRYNELYGTKRARFGWFDTIEDEEVARLLLGAAESWAKAQGMEEIHGPLYYNTLGKQGMVVEGYDRLPPFNCLYNYPYYNDFVLSAGYRKECDWLQYRLKADQELDGKLREVAAKLRDKFDLHEARIRDLKRDRRMIRKFFRLYNESFSAAVYNFIPFTDEEIEEESESFSPFLNDRNSVIILDRQDEPVAFGVTFPSISEALRKCRGRLFPFGWLSLLSALRHCENVDLMINGAAPQWQNTGVSAVVHCAMSDRYKAGGTKWAVTNPQIETNGAVNIWHRYERELYIRRRCYVKPI